MDYGRAGFGLRALPAATDIDIISRGLSGWSLGRAGMRQARVPGGPEAGSPKPEAAACRIGLRRRTTFGKSRQTGTPQKCVPSVQRGEIEPVADDARRADVARRAAGATARTCADLVHRRQVDLLLRVEAGAHRPLVQQRDAAAPTRRSAASSRSAARRARTRAARRARAAGSSPSRRRASPRSYTASACGLAGDQPRRDVVGRGRCPQTSSAAATPAPCGGADPASRRCGSGASANV